MKKLIASCVALSVIVCAVVFFVINSVCFLIATILCCVFFSGFTVLQYNISEQREEWIKNPVPAKMEVFDAFFWKLVIAQQDWYLENIYTEKDIRSLISQYEQKIISIWSDTNCDVEHKVRLSEVYTDRIKSLCYSLGHINTKVQSPVGF